MRSRERILATLRTLEAWGHDRGWSGSDQYDALNATRVPEFVLRTALGRRLVIQAVKRCPIDLRPLLGIAPGVNAVSVAWAASAYALNGFLPEPEAARRLGDALETLHRLRLDSYGASSWGYHFDFQSRVFFYPRSTPNAIATVFAGMALLDAYERRGDTDLLDAAHDVGRFFLREVPQTPDPPGSFFGYLPGDRSPIHNSNLLVSALLARLQALTGDRQMRNAAHDGLRWSIARQRPDGSWPYGETASLQWIDNFHTGYVLEALHTCLQAGFPEALEPLRRGIAFYETRMFLADGTPRYFVNRTYPIDMWCVAQAIQTFSIVSQVERRLLDRALGVFAFALREMRGRDGSFIFQKTRLWSNRTRHVRGVVAPTVLALAHLLARLPANGTPRQISRGQLRPAGTRPSPAGFSTEAASARTDAR